MLQDPFNWLSWTSCAPGQQPSVASAAARPTLFPAASPGGIGCSVPFWMGGDPTGQNKKRAFFPKSFPEAVPKFPLFFLLGTETIGQFDRFYEEHVPKFLHMMVLLIAHGFNEMI